MVQVHPWALYMEAIAEKRVILNWQEVVSSVGVSLDKVPKDLCSLINRCIQNGVGTPVSRQKTSYSQHDLNILSIAIRWWVYLDCRSNSSWRDVRNGKEIQNRLVHSLVTGDEVVLFAIFCPSYKTGVGVHGYKTKIGLHTKAMIKDFCNLAHFSQSIGIKVRPIAYFSDLLLENLDKLSLNDKDDLVANYRSFCEEFLSYGEVYVETPLLSSNKRCKTEIGEAGVDKDNARVVDDDLYNRILKRNEVFYKDKLLWDSEKIKQRTNVICGSYVKLAEIFRQQHPQGIMFWTESLFERGLIYSQNDNNYIPIIYPLKHAVA